MKKLQTIIAIISVLIVAVAVVLTAKYCNRVEDVTTTTETTTESTEISTTEPITEVLTETETTTTTTTEKTEYTPSPHLTEDGYVTPEFFRKHGVIYGNGYWFTWYSEKVLPGGGLNIPGRWSDGNYVRDEDGYIVMAHETLPMGKIIDSPFGEGKIYDRCETPKVIDVYTSW